jgi:hypothetical protein
VYKETKQSEGSSELAITYCHDGAQVTKETAEFERHVLSCLGYLPQLVVKQTPTKSYCKPGHGNVKQHPKQGDLDLISSHVTTLAMV